MSRTNTMMSGLWRSSRIALSGFLAFLLRPSLYHVQDGAGISRKALVLWLLIFSFATSAAFGLLALPLILVMDAAPAEELRTILDGSPTTMIVAVVVVGPLVEEILFRGWLPGTMRAFVGSAAFVILWFGGSWAVKTYAPQAASLPAHIGLAAIGLSGFVVIMRGRERSPVSRYRTLFPVFFWSQGLLFGGLHFANISSSSMLLPLLTAAPLIICGWLWGYARLKCGFGAAWYSTWRITRRLSRLPWRSGSNETF